MSNTDSNDNQKPGRKRSLTSITLGWIAERMRKAERIKQEVESGAYNVDSDKIAAALANANGEKN